MYEQGYSQNIIVTTMGLSDYAVSTALAFLKMHGKEEFIKYYINKEHKKFTPLEISNIVELCYSKNLSAYKVALAFKAPLHAVYNVLQERKYLNEPVIEGSIPAKLPEGFSIEKLKGRSREDD